MICRFAALLAVLVVVGCTVGKPPAPPPVITPPASEAGVAAGMPADAAPIFGDAAIPGCAALCLRCPELAPDGGDCALSCTAVLYAVNGGLDATCVTKSVDCNEAVRCIR